MRNLNPLQLLPLPLLQNHNIRLLFLQRFVRLAAYGSSTLILAQFFSALHHPTGLIGLFMTLTLYGDVLISLLLTLFADRLGRRKILLLGAALMTLSGITFATASNFWILLLAAIVGVVSPAGNEIGPFKAIEESVTAQIVDAGRRTEVFAWYTLVGALGSALGSVLCGWAVSWIINGGAEAERAYRMVFWAYAVMGVVKMGLAWGLTEECEVGGGDSARVAVERERLVQPVVKEKRSKILELLLPEMSKESLSILWKLCLLFSIDSLASGLAAPSWMTYYFTTKHSLPPSTLGTLFLFTSLASASSSLLAVPIAARLGLIRTMVYTHLPAAVLLMFIPVPPGTKSGTAIAMSFLVVRSLMASMDQAPRTAFLAAVMLPRERTAVMGVVNTVKTFSQAAGPAVTGWAGGHGAMGAAFSVAGGLKVSYDLGLLTWFLRGGSAEGRGEGEGEGYSAVRSEEEEAANEMEELEGEVSGSEDGGAGRR